MEKSNKELTKKTDELKSDFKQDIKELKADMEKSNKELKADMEKSNKELKTDFMRDLQPFFPYILKVEDRYQSYVVCSSLCWLLAFPYFPDCSCRFCRFMSLFFAFCVFLLLYGFIFCTLI